ncbi:MAG: SMC family ATPase [Chloroflexia bacterium]|nr:SMC family ATPase [Chloroflexia bacterium]
MILAKLTIENFKQFRGEQEIEFPSSGIIAVMGPNGAGKTTLFDAIEWCLYKPNRLKVEDIVPRGTAGRPRVQVVLEDPRTGVRHVVERSVGGSQSIKAAVYREDDPENRLSQGTRDVTAFVATHLVGLSHAAFVATFFTRQKELTYFGTMGETERRREVGRLLGYETIALAQATIGDQRAAANQTARALANQVETETGERDLGAEWAVLDKSLADADLAVVGATAAVERTGAERASRAAITEALRQRERQDAGILRSLTRAEAESRAARDRVGAASLQLANLDDVTRKRQELLPIASDLPSREVELARQDAEASRFREQRTLDEAMARARTGLGRVAETVRQRVVASTAPAVPGWAWGIDDATDPAGAIRRLREVAAGLDPWEARARVETGQALLDLSTERAAAAKKLGDCQRRLETLRATERDVLAGGDPEAALVQHREARERAIAARADAASVAQGLAKERAKLDAIVVRLRQTEFEGEDNLCPTCRRPFAAHEIETMVAAFAENIAGVGSREAAAVARRSAAERDQQRLDQAIAAESARLDHLRDARARIERGTEVTGDATGAAATSEERFALRLAGSGRQAPPTAGEIERETAHAAALEVIDRHADALGLLEVEAGRHLAEGDQARHDRAALGPVTYDEGTHAAAREALSGAREAVIRIDEFDQQLAQRPLIEAARAVAMGEAAEHEAALATLVAERAALGFDPTSLERAVAGQEGADQDERAAREAHNAATARLDHVRRDREDLRKAQERLEGLVRRADEARREHGLLQELHSTFGLFEQYVAGRVTPHFAEQTGDLLATVTGGRYDHVTFDQNYGIKVYDGPDEAFPIAAFSGGEHDVIALCARLALSRLVGAQAATPPSFLVLDEVFGALDRDRRSHVLDTLGALAGTSEAYRQLFIISHVDDIRQSSIFDDILRIAEGEDGSTIERVGMTLDGAVEEG